MQDVQTEISAPAPAADARPAPLPLRNDTILGVCEAIGSDFGFHPNWLRVAFASLMFLNPVAVIGTYLALGLAVALSRWLAPAKPAEVAAPHLAAETQAPQDNVREDSESVPLAA